MDCQAFESWCEQRFDERRSFASIADAPDVAAHVASCSDCQAVASRYGRLEAAIGLWSGTTVLSDGLSDRIVAAVLDDRRSVSILTIDRRAVFAAAALILVALGLGIRHSLIATRPGSVEVVTTPNPPPLPDALEAARTVTLDLARKTTEPASRVGSRIIAQAKFPTSPQLSLSMPVRPASRIISVLGDDVNRGVKPLSGSARNAFGFLLAPWPHDKGDAPERSGQGA